MTADIIIDINALSKDTAKATSAETLWAVFVSFCRSYGIPYARISAFMPTAKVEINNIVYLQVYEIDGLGWPEYYIKERLFDYDQSIHLVRRPGVEFLKWTQMAKMTRKGSQARRVFKDAKEFGLHEGLLVLHKSKKAGITVFLGIAGPEDMLDPLGRKALKYFVLVLHSAIERMIELALAESKIDYPSLTKNAQLTRGEYEVLMSLSLGYTQKEISDQRGVKEKSVNTMIDRMKDRLGQKTTIAAMAYSFRNNLIS